MLKLLLGGSPCTHWSIAQSRNRETAPEGMGWELFKNYLIARDKFCPDYFLYENNKSMSAAIREQITRELGVEPILINSALLSAQNRQRLYWTNIPGVVQPEDKGILLRDILESGVCWHEKAYTLRASAGAHSGMFNVLRNIETGGKWGYMGAAEPVNLAGGEKSHAVKAQTAKSSPANLLAGGGHFPQSGAAVPVCLNSKSGRAGVPGLQPGLANRIYSTEGKGSAITTAFHPKIAVPLMGAETVTGISPVGETADGKAFALTAYYSTGQNPEHTLNKSLGTMVAVPAGMAWRGHAAHGNPSSFEMRSDGKSNTLTAEGHQNSLMIEDAAIYQRPRGFNRGGMKYAKAPTLTANGDWPHNNYLIEAANGKTYPVYEVSGGQITIKGRQYPIRLADGWYIIRKLTVRECMRLQTVPENYSFPVSDTQEYKMLGNGWTVDVIAHILSFCPGITAEPLAVLSMYDGMSCGHIALDKLGANIAAYWATEIDKYAILTTQTNYPATVQLGDAFQVRQADWRVPYILQSL